MTRTILPLLALLAAECVFFGLLLRSCEPGRRLLQASTSKTIPKLLFEDGEKPRVFVDVPVPNPQNPGATRTVRCQTDTPREMLTLLDEAPDHIRKQCLERDADRLKVYALGAGLHAQVDSICPGAALGPIQEGVADMAFSRLYRAEVTGGGAYTFRPELAVDPVLPFRDDGSPFALLSYDFEAPECPRIDRKKHPKKKNWVEAIGALIHLNPLVPLDPKDIAATMAYYEAFASGTGAVPEGCHTRSGRIKAYTLVRSVIRDEVYCDPDSWEELPDEHDRAFLKAATDARTGVFAKATCEDPRKPRKPDRRRFVVLRFDCNLQLGQADAGNPSVVPLGRVLTFPVFSRIYVDPDGNRYLNPLLDSVDNKRLGELAMDEHGWLLPDAPQDRDLLVMATQRGGPYRVKKAWKRGVELERAADGRRINAPERVTVSTTTPTELRRSMGRASPSKLASVFPFDFSSGTPPIVTECEQLGQACLFHGAFAADQYQTSKSTPAFLAARNRNQRDAAILLFARVGSHPLAAEFVRSLGRDQRGRHKVLNKALNLANTRPVQEPPPAEPHDLLPPPFKLGLGDIPVGLAPEPTKGRPDTSDQELSLYYNLDYEELYAVGQELVTVAKELGFTLRLHGIMQDDIDKAVGGRWTEEERPEWDLLLNYVVGYADEFRSLYRIYTPHLAYNFFVGEDRAPYFHSLVDGRECPYTLRRLFECYESLAIHSPPPPPGGGVGGGRQDPCACGPPDEDPPRHRFRRASNAYRALARATRDGSAPYLVLGYVPVWVNYTPREPKPRWRTRPVSALGVGVFSSHIRFCWRSSPGKECPKAR